MEQAAIAETIAGLPDTSQYQPKHIDIRLLQDLRKKNLSYSQIAKIAGCSKANVLFRLEGFQCEQEDIQTYKENEAEAFRGLRLRIVKTLTDEDIKKAGFRDRMVGLGILVDKELDLTQGRETTTVQVTLNQVNGVLDGIMGLRDALQARVINIPEPCKPLAIGASDLPVDENTENPMIPRGDSLHNNCYQSLDNTPQSAVVDTQPPMQAQSVSCTPGLPRVKRSYAFKSKGKGRRVGGRGKTTRARTKVTSLSTQNKIKKGPFWSCSCSFRNTNFVRVCKSCGKEKSHV